MSIFEEIKTAYQEHLQEMEDHFCEKEPKNLLSSVFSGKGRYGGTDYPQKFLEHIKNIMEKVAEEGITAEEAEKTLRFMLLEAEVEAAHPCYWDFCVAEQYVGCLVDAASKEGVSSLYEEYRKRLKKEIGLPAQKKIEKQLKEKCKT